MNDLVVRGQIRQGERGLNHCALGVKKMPRTFTKERKKMN